MNVWYWSVDGEIEELFVGGLGFMIEFEWMVVEMMVSYDDGWWMVVMLCLFDLDVVNWILFVVDNDVDVVFVVWNGFEMECFGWKLVSEWYYFLFGFGL